MWANFGKPDSSRISSSITRWKVKNEKGVHLETKGKNGLHEPEIHQKRKRKLFGPVCCSFVSAVQAVVIHDGLVHKPSYGACNVRRVDPSLGSAGDWNT